MTTGSGDSRYPEGISVAFPVYNDERTVRTVAEKAMTVASRLTDQYEVVIVDDGSPDRSGEIADQLAAEYDCITVVHHEQNKGYGSAVRSGLAACRYEWICCTDGDDEYDLHDLTKLWRLRNYYDLIITFRYVKIYSSRRILISWVYNQLLRQLFRTSYRDISTGLRLVRKSLIDELELESSGPFIGAEMAIKSMLKGFPVGEVGIQTFPREFGVGASVSVPNIIKTIEEMLYMHRRIFSADYDLPENRARSNAQRSWLPFGNRRT